MLSKTLTFLLKSPILDDGNEMLIESNGYKFKCIYKILEKKEISELDIYETLIKEKFNVFQIGNMQFENFVIPLSSSNIFCFTNQRVYKENFYFYKIKLEEINEIRNKEVLLCN